MGCGPFFFTFLGEVVAVLVIRCWECGSLQFSVHGHWYLLNCRGHLLRRTCCTVIHFSPLMSKFSDKAVCSKVNLTLLDGRGGEELKLVAQRLQDTLFISREQVEDYFDAFSIFPLDRNKCVTLDALKSFYEKAGLDLSTDDCEDAMIAFTGNDLTHSLDFETYVINMERWAKKDIHTKGILNTAYDVFSDTDDNRITPERLRFLFKSVDGPPLDENDVSRLVQYINVYCGDEDLYGFV